MYSRQSEMWWEDRVRDRDQQKKKNDESSTGMQTTDPWDR